jgi:hypothetical protein
MIGAGREKALDGNERVFVLGQARPEAEAALRHRALFVVAPSIGDAPFAEQPR